MGKDDEAGPLAGEKLGTTSDPGHPQPQAAETESARLLANQARGDLSSRGLDEDAIRTFADEYIALDIGEDVDAFIEWASQRGGRQRA